MMVVRILTSLFRSDSQLRSRRSYAVYYFHIDPWLSPFNQEYEDACNDSTNSVQDAVDVALRVAGYPNENGVETDRVKAFYEIGESMIEIGILIVVMLAFIGGGLAVWKFTRGPAKQRRGLAPRIAVLSLMSIVLVPTSAWELSKSRTFQWFGNIVTRVDTSAPVVALTFDDGPSQFTEEVLAILREHDVKATFFVTGQAVEENMAAAQSIVEEGHELGNHSYSHQRMILKPYSFIQQEIENTDQLIREAGYERDIHFRSPYGKRFIVLPYYLDQTDRLNIFYDVEPESCREIAADAGRIVEHVLEKTRPGSIVLLHVMPGSRVESRKALSGVIQGLQEQGYSFVTVAELLAFNSETVKVFIQEEK